MLLSYDPIYQMNQSITTWANSLCRSSKYGLPMESKTNWYTGLSDVEILARLIYAENASNQIDQIAITWVLLNRYHNANYPNTFRGVATQKSQFSTISGTGSSLARNPGSYPTTWYHATWLACALLSTNNKSNCQELFGKPQGIAGQHYFRGISSFVNNIANSTSGANCILFGTKKSRLKNVVIVNKDNINKSLVVNATRIKQIKDIKAKYGNQYNVFFSYE